MTDKHDPNCFLCDLNENGILLFSRLEPEKVTIHHNNGIAFAMGYAFAYTRIAGEHISQCRLCAARHKNLLAQICEDHQTTLMMCVSEGLAPRAAKS